MTAQVFISYARDDDIPPPGQDEAKGFVGYVTYLDRQLRYELTQLGQPRPGLWRDIRRIESGDQFEPLIEEAVAASSLFVAILSRNWLHRPWCGRELESFRQRWSSESEKQFKRRIIVVFRHPVPESEIPTLLRGQEGFRFFHEDRDSEAGQWQEFFARGRVRDRRYEERVGELARFLWQAWVRFETPGVTLEPERHKGPSLTPPGSHGRTIYLTKPAADMRLAYDRIAKELQHAGYSIVPPPESEIPYEGAAPGFVDAALAGAELSIHLLGDKPGYSPEDAAPIVKLQLARAAARAEAPQASERVFRRILWAPCFLPEEGEAGAERDPFAVVARLGRQLDGDKVFGGNLSAFADFLVQHLEQSAPSREVSGAIPDGAQVYVYHRSEDADYAFDLVVALRQRRLNAVLPAVEGEAADLAAFHREMLRECQAVVLCWAKASEVWARATCRELRSWEKLGRSERFTVRGLVAGPPPGGRKSVLVRLPPEDGIDVVLDLTALDKPSSAALDPLIRPAAAPPAE